MREYISLYRRLRPSRFSDIVGQPHVSRTLSNAVAKGRVNHAYLFCGPRGTGKTTTARILAKAVNCLDPKGAEPCNNCSSCTRIGKGSSMDVVEIDGASNRGIDEIRELREKIKLVPAEEKYKVYIVDEVHMLTGEAFNALLKTLEEPPQRTIFILATTEPHKLPETILSRCQRFDFRRISSKEIEKYLKKVTADSNIGAEPEALKLIAKMSGGSLRDALSLLEQCTLFSENGLSKDNVELILGKAEDAVIKDLMGAVFKGDAAKAVEILESIISEGRDISYIFNDIMEYFRGLLLAAAAGDQGLPLINYEEEILEEIKKQADLFPAEIFFKMAEELADYEKKLKWSNQPQLILELAVIKLCTYCVPKAAKESASVSDELSPAVLEERKGKAVSAAAEKEALNAQDKISPLGEPKEAETQRGMDQTDLDFETICSCWPEIMGLIKKKMISLHALL
ncbi:MAG: DNA polymerase III subunit gamma/tau, partial [Clostridia bacterium]|nr:DNA polymerase III subunit gamma/tau [Clostridia bacterium]